MKQPIPLHQALVRPLLVGGGEREPMGVVVTAGLCQLALAWQYWSLWALVGGLFFLIVIPQYLVKVAKMDPKAFAVYRRYMKRRAFYPARSTPYGRG
jgi:type IV secretion system protein VirB3